MCHEDRSAALADEEQSAETKGIRIGNAVEAVIEIVAEMVEAIIDIVD